MTINDVSYIFGSIFLAIHITVIKCYLLKKIEMTNGIGPI